VVILVAAIACKSKDLLVTITQVVSDFLGTFVFLTQWGIFIPIGHGYSPFFIFLFLGEFHV
jgi:hypothetical protein